ncbi:MAG: hypothetical protein ACI9EW_003503 [Cellvibrionaceae bacterium]|jgi:hypothetical protein
MKHSAAPWGLFVKVISALITVLICTVFWLAAPISSDNESVAFRMFLILLPVLLLGSSALFIILRYEISSENIEVVRVVGRTKYRLDNIKSVEFEPTSTDLSIRTFGNGGLYSISGFFRNTQLGAYRAYVTNAANCVVIRRKQGSPIVLSPHDPIRFVEQVTLSIEIINPMVEKNSS